MKQLLLFYKLECKRILKRIPHILEGAIALSLVIGAIAFCAGNMLYTNKTDNNYDIAYSMEDDNRITEMVFNMLKGSESLSSICSFTEMTKQDSLNLLKENQLIAAIHIPKGFMDSLMCGDNYSIQISLPVRMSLYSVILVELTKSLETTLVAAQAGVYTLYDYYKASNTLQYEDEANLALNSIYLTRSFNRALAFQSHTVSATGAISVTEYYICSGVVILILMLSTTLIQTIRSNSNIMNLKLQQAGIGDQHIILSKVFAVTITLFLLLYSSMLIVFILNILNILPVAFRLEFALINSFMISFCGSCVIVFIIFLSNGKTNGTLLLFILITAMCFISGCFIPQLLLPDILKDISVYLPSTHMMNLMEDIMQNRLSANHLLIALSSGIVLYLGTVLNLHIRNRMFGNVLRNGGKYE